MNRGIVDDLRLLVGKQVFVAAVLRDEALAHARLPLANEEKDSKDDKDFKDTGRAGLLVLGVLDVLAVLG